MDRPTKQVFQVNYELFWVCLSAGLSVFALNCFFTSVYSLLRSVLIIRKVLKKVNEKTEFFSTALNW